MQPCLGHNWMFSPIRGYASIANDPGTARSLCGLRKPTDVNAQIGPGQFIPIEWSTGHGGAALSP